MLSFLLATATSASMCNFMAGVTATLTIYSVAKTGRNVKVKLS